MTSFLNYISESDFDRWRNGGSKELDYPANVGFPDSSFSPLVERCVGLIADDHWTFYLKLVLLHQNLNHEVDFSRLRQCAAATEECHSGRRRALVGP
jgi:hypothetical protein